MLETKLVNNMFEFLPRTKELIYKKEEERLKIMKGVSERLNPKHQHYYFCKNVSDLFYKRLSSSDKNYKWTINNYYKTKGYLIKIKDNQIQYLEKAIIKFLETDNESIIKELSNFKEKVIWYPERERIKEGNSYISYEKEIEVTDIFLVATRIISLMQRTINEKAKMLLETKNDFETLCELIKEIKEDKVRNEESLKQFDEEYKFLLEYSLLKNVYEEVRNNYYNILLESLRILHNKYDRNRATENYQKNYLAKLERRKEQRAISDKRRRTNY